MEIKGLYIEDDKKNITVVRALFEMENVFIEELDNLPDNVSDLYSLIIKKNVDFLIIDHELDKMVTYKGIDALREIRKCDSTIYAILLTNYPLEDFKDEFGDYDYQINKKDLGNKIKEISQKLKRACELRQDNCILSEIEQSQNERQKILETLKIINQNIKKEE